MVEYEVQIEEIQEYPKVIEPNDGNFVYGSFTNKQQPIERLLSSFDSEFYGRSVEYSAGILLNK
ncbi:hypothetical protein ENUP19_0338G0004 [Entamoeba nuttalli]|uniref:Uncharacterized protein n=1 Tax=Entamoeba nuttalli TaxID=412467 RepID=A0ABQ0DJK5_9EUKA